MGPSITVCVWVGCAPSWLTPLLPDPTAAFLVRNVFPRDLQTSFHYSPLEGLRAISESWERSNRNFCSSPGRAAPSSAAASMTFVSPRHQLNFPRQRGPQPNVAHRTQRQRLCHAAVLRPEPAEHRGHHVLRCGELHGQRCCGARGLRARSSFPRR